MRRVVVTGLGAVTPNGNSFIKTWDSFLKLESGISKITKFDTADLKVKIAGEVKDFSLENFGLDLKFKKRTDLVSQFAVVAANEAMADSGLREGIYSPQRSGCTVSSGFGGVSTYDENIANLLNVGPKKVTPFFVPKVLTNMPGGWVSMQLNLQGYISACAAACATGAVSVIDGYRAIKDDIADVVFAGASEASVSKLLISAFSNLKVLSTKNDAPELASSPFDAKRDGFVLSEGATVLVLEELENALSRGAKIYAEITGWGITSDASHFTHPAKDARGMVGAMKMALKTAKLKPESIQYVNAHGTSTKMNDSLETKAIKNVFGEHAKKFTLSSTKSMSGHLLAAAGALEAAVVVKSIKEQKIHATANLHNLDPECDLNYCSKGKRLSIENAMSNSFGFGGVNAVLVFSRFN